MVSSWLMGGGRGAYIGLDTKRVRRSEVRGSRRRFGW